MNRAAKESGWTASRWAGAALATLTIVLVALVAWLAAMRPDAVLLGPLVTAAVVAVFITLGTICIATRRPSSGAAGNASLEKTLDRIDEHLALSDTARRFVYRERELEMLKLMLERDIQAGRFEPALRVVEELGQGYGLLGEAEAYRNRIEQTRRGEVRRQLDEGLQQIRSLVGGGNWSLAARTAEGLRRRFPDAAEIQDLPNQIAASRHRYAAELEEQVRGALKEHRIDEAMQGLRELDRHLVGDEVGRMADVAQTIIVAHRDLCGSRFRQAVADHDWSKALEIGDLITTDYPNTRMAEEVAGLLPGIRWRVDPSGPPPQTDATPPETSAATNGG